MGRRAAKKNRWSALSGVEVAAEGCRGCTTRWCWRRAFTDPDQIARKLVCLSLPRCLFFCRRGHRWTGEDSRGWRLSGELPPQSLPL